MNRIGFRAEAGNNLCVNRCTVNRGWLIVCQGIGEIEEQKGAQNDDSARNPDLLFPSRDTAASHFRLDDVNQTLRENKKRQATNDNWPKMAGGLDLHGVHTDRLDMRFCHIKPALLRRRTSL